MGFRIEAPKQDGNARFNTLKVNLNENNSLTRTVVSDSEGNFYYSTTGGGGGTGGTNGTSGTSGPTGSPGSSGTSGTSGTGFKTIYEPLQGRVLISDGTVNAATASSNVFYNTGSSTLQIIGGLESNNLLVNTDTFEFTGSVRITGSLSVTGSLEVLGGITGSLLGTASYALTASHALNVVGTASWAYNALTASSADDFYIRADRFEFTGSVEVNGGITGSLYGTSSWAVSASWTPGAGQAETASFVTASNVWGPYGSNSIISASYAATASSADSFYIRSDRFEFTGSVEVNGGITGSLLGTASFANTASYALNVPATSSWAINAITASSADNFLVRGTLTAQTIVAQVITSSTEYITGSTIFGSQLSNTHQFTGSVSITGSLTSNDLTVLADRFEFTGSMEVNGGITGSLFGTSSWAVSASWAPSAQQSATASFVTASNVWGPYGSNSIISASYAATASSADDFYIRADTFQFTGSVEVQGGITGSLLGTSSYAVTASYAQNAASVFPYIGNAVISGSLTITGSGIVVTGSVDISETTTTKRLTVGSNPLSSYAVNLIPNFSGSSLIGTLWSNPTLHSGSINNYTFIQSRFSTTASNFTVSTATHFTAAQGTIGVGSRVNNQYGFFASVLMNGAQNNYGFYGGLNTGASGSWNLYMIGTAPNILTGNTSIGATDTSTYKLNVVGPVRISGSFQITGSLEAPTITGSLFGTSSYALTASYALNPQTASWAYNALTASSADDFYIRADTFQFTGSVEVQGGITGSLLGTSSFSILALTASYIDPSNIPGVSGFKITTGSINASVNVTPQNLFLINSGFTEYLNISSSGNTDIYSNLFIVRNFTTKQPVLIVSESVIQIATQSFNPIGNTQAGSIWFTSSSMFVGLD